MKPLAMLAALVASPALAFHCRITDDTAPVKNAMATSCFEARENEPTKRVLSDKNYSVSIEDYVGNFAIRIVDNRSRKEVLSASRERESLKTLTLTSSSPKVGVRCSIEPLKDCEKLKPKD
ncbi:MAG: hypothetical protein EOP04_01325 [Proteobacteria bacterium]|nr:MAG: hypothetical protein EOP04_01325 [Pseudomonadota bacterium]